MKKNQNNMRITIEAMNMQEVEKLLFLLKSLDIKNIEILPSPSGQTAPITKGDKKIDPRSLFGIWKDHPRSLEAIRATDWKRDFKNRC